ncbi:hypothetical protein e2701_00004 [Klebsiella phage e270.1]|uniref:hypothetical protein n=1 Tax=Klebsiella pneumoniae TaxID=573 RepID=UPI000F7EDC6E|nr:hypothetical protein [Klebsiella pneumoniae]WDQ26619.1 hypothetical protein phiKPNH21_00006 [Klebsiella phage phi_KPN_H2]WMT10443.1 hypothetical protein phi270_00048 [Klebsiella phage phi_270]WMT10564.1 hypothetical protein e2701_00004 [Klebsiella phage e270.1]WMT10651.1 hypothetical protein e2702_00004 [Klebsiella phage e270.2]RTA29721.1 hypothetical protein EJ496_27925 [Klebsiella pneumoniae subsp. pneumoniae]
MKRSDAEHKHSQGYKSIEGQNCLSHFQSAETLEEINQKTLTVRDQFAIAALQGLIAHSSENQPIFNTPDEAFSYYAKGAYAYADAMMEARNK